MRILEQCSTAWPMPEIQSQIDSLRLAFSADVSRPFELKPTFPYGSPSEPYQPSPPPFDSSHYTPPMSQVTGGVQSRVGYSTYPISPPISTGTEDAKSDSSQLQPLGMITTHPVSSHSMEAPLVDENSWDPTRIIKYEPNFQNFDIDINLHLFQSMGYGIFCQSVYCQQHKFATHELEQSRAGSAAVFANPLSYSVWFTCQGGPSHSTSTHLTTPI